MSSLSHGLGLDSESLNGFSNILFPLKDVPADRSYLKKLDSLAFSVSSLSTCLSVFLIHPSSVFLTLSFSLCLSFSPTLCLSFSHSLSSSLTHSLSIFLCHSLSFSLFFFSLILNLSLFHFLSFFLSLSHTHVPSPDHILQT